MRLLWAPLFIPLARGVTSVFRYRLLGLPVLGKVMEG